jgi:hypothetical protein
VQRPAQCRSCGDHDADSGFGFLHGREDAPRLALYRSGRQADALSEYRETRRVLDDGLEPSPALRELEQAILRHDPLLTAVAAGAAPVESVATPEQPLPRRRRRFVFALTLFVFLLAAGAFAVSADVDFPGASHAALKNPAPATTALSPVSHLGTHPSRPHVRRVVHRKTVARPKSKRHPAEPVSTVAPVTAVTHTPAVTTAPTPITTSPKQAVAPVRTRPIKTTTTTTPSRSSWRTLSDDFSESTPKWTMWNADTEGAGATWALESGQLDLTLLGSGVPGGRYDQLSEGFGSQCRFNGDFDARVDYQLIEWVPPTGARVQLSAWIFPDVNSDTARTSGTQGGESYWGDLASSHNSRPTNDTEGALRITRTNGLVKSYFLDRTWVQLNAARVVGQVMLGLQLFAPAADWQQKETRIAFDNFSVSAPAMICP